MLSNGLCPDFKHDIVAIISHDVIGIKWFEYKFLNLFFLEFLVEDKNIVILFDGLEKLSWERVLEELCLYVVQWEVFAEIHFKDFIQVINCLV